MNTKRLIDFTIVLTLVGLLGTHFYNNYISPRKKTIKREKITKANDILKYKTVISPKILNTTATSSACTLFLKNSAEFSMNDYANEFIDHQVDGILKTCSGAFPDALQSLINTAILKCKSSTREKITSECYSALMNAKTKSVATIIRPDADLKDLDATILLHLIADGFSSNTIFENPKKSLELVNALLEKEPNYLGGYKVKLLLLSMSGLTKEERYKDMFEDTLIDAKRLRNNDPEILELSLTQKDLASLKDEAALHPKEWIYDYYIAKTIYDSGKGDYQKTVNLIEAALKKSPDNIRLKETLKSLKSDDEAKRKYPFTSIIIFSLDDL